MGPILISLRNLHFLNLIITLLCRLQFKWASAFDVSFSPLPSASSALKWSRCRHRSYLQSRWTHLYLSTTIVDPKSVLDIQEVAHLSSLVDKRSRARWDGNYEAADNIREQIQAFPLPSSYTLWMEDIPRKQGGGTNWKLVREDNPEDHIMDGPTILHLAQTALGLAIEASIQSSSTRANAEARFLFSDNDTIGDDTNWNYEYNGDDECTHKLQSVVAEAKTRLQQDPDVLQYELNGRKSADAAFWFALAGVPDNGLYQNLADIATKELTRFGLRESCRTTDILQILARFSAAGLLQNEALVEVASHCLAYKSQKKDSNDGLTFDTDDEMLSGHSKAVDTPLLDLHSNRSLLLVWKFSTKQTKQGAFLQPALQYWENHKANSSEKLEPDNHPNHELHKTSPTHNDSKLAWNQKFDDPTRPLIIDIGCGMGVSLLGLAACKEDSRVLGCRWPDCNLLGVDAGSLGIDYATSLAARWGFDCQLQFVVDTAEHLLESIQTYPGPVQLCLIQFPTPYRLEKAPPGDVSSDIASGGNSQLPCSPDDGFMVSKKLLSLVRDVLLKSNGRLLLQSNCEDVVVWMRNTACNHVNGGFDYVDEDFSSAWKPTPPSAPRIPQRTAEWVSMGGERAQGPGWISQPVLPRQGATETEIACILNGTPVHRCVLIPRR